MIRNFLGVLLLFVLLAFICGLLSSGPLADLVQGSIAPLGVDEGSAAQQAMVQQFGKDFPPSASDFYRAARGDQADWLRVSVAPNEINQLFGGSAFFTCHFPLQPAYRPVFEFSRVLNATDQARMTWWDPNNTSIGTYSGGECTGSDYRFFRMFVDQTSPARWTFYMEVIRH